MRNLQNLFLRHRIQVGLVASMLALAMAAPVSFGEEPTPIEIEDSLPFNQKPIAYHSPTTLDSVAALQQKLDSNEVTLKFDSHFGYLMSVLSELKIPVDSQVLVYSKTARNPRLVKPKNPRAIFFNDTVSVGWVPGATELEVTGIDGTKGGMFYTIPQRPPTDDEPNRFERSSRCLSCHRGNTTYQVPGFIVRSFVTDRLGKPISGFSRITHDTEISKRFGGWYVTGLPSDQVHRGNLVSEDDIQQHKRDATYRGTLRKLAPLFDVSRYPAPTSDVVAQLVLQHQAHGLNLLMRVGYEHRLGRKSDAEDRLFRYLLFLDEARFEAPIQGNSKYASWFAAQPPFEAMCDGSIHRSLRQFDLQTRLFNYRLSYLIYSPLFDRLPDEVRSRIYRRLWNALRGRDSSIDPKLFPQSERDAIIEIVRATKLELPNYWRECQR